MALLISSRLSQTNLNCQFQRTVMNNVIVILIFIFSLVSMSKLRAETLTGIYAGAALGFSKVSWAQQGYKLNANPLALGVILGFNYALTNKWMLGGEMNVLNKDGQVKAANTTIPTDKYSKSIKDLSILATGTYIIDDTFDVFAKLGYARVSQIVPSWAVKGMETPGNKTAYKPKIVLGIGYMPTEKINAFVQAEYILGAKDNKFYNPNTRAFSRIMVGITYTIPLFPPKLPESKLLSQNGLGASPTDQFQFGDKMEKFKLGGA